MQLSEHFALAEFTRSEKADSLGIANVPTDEEIARMKALCHHVLEPVRAEFGPVYLSSGFRCEALNLAVDGAATSQHRLGEAADIGIPGAPSLYDAALWIEYHLNYDQLILEEANPVQPHAGWIHVSWSGRRMRNEELTFDGHRYRPGLMRP